MDGTPGSDSSTLSSPFDEDAAAAQGETVALVREQVEWFTRWAAAVGAVTTAAEFVLLATGVLSGPAAPALFAASTVGLVAAWLLARADRTGPAVAVSTISFGALTVAAAILLPTFYVIAAALPGVAALIAVPFLRGRQLTAMLVFVWTVGGAAATVGLALHLPADADAVGVALTGVTLAVVALFSALSLFRLSARFRADRDRALASEAQYRALFDGSPVATVAYATDDFRVLAVNQAAAALYGTPRERLLRMSYQDLVDPALHDRLEEIVPTLRTDRFVPLPSGWRHRRADGSLIEVDGASLSIPYGGSTARLSVILDVTESRRSAAAAAEATRRLEEAQATAHIGSWTAEAGVTGFDDGWTTWSAEGLRILGLPPDTGRARGDSFYDMVHPDDRALVIEAGRRVITVDEPYEIEHRIVRPDGEVRLVHERGSVQRDGAERPVRFVGTIEDVTDRHDLERRLAAAERLEAVGRLAGGIAHDFNNLLTVIGGNAEIARDLTAPDAPAYSAMEAVVDAARRSAGLTRQLLAFARRQRLEPRPVDLVATVDALASTVRDLAGPRITVTIAHRRSGTVVLADPAGLDQVILNLVSNARDAMPDGGGLTIETDAAPARGDRQAIGILVVRDTGVGMTPETAAHVFEPFFTMKAAGGGGGSRGTDGTGRTEPGTGLGLAIVHGIVEQSGGSIEIESRPGSGAAFRVRLPLVAAGGAEPATSDAGTSVSARGRVLVVEDDVDVAAFVTTALAGLGHEVRVAGSAQTALDLLAAVGSPGGASAFDLVLTDVVMPGISGWDLADRIRRDLPGMPVVLMSGYAEEAGPPPGDRQAWPMLEKPFSIETLGATVGAALERRAGRVSSATEPD